MSYQFKDLIIDPERRTVLRGTEDIRLHALTFDTFLALIKSAPEPMDVDAFSQIVWESGYLSQETLAQRITLLRKALRDDPKNPVYIRTVRSKGYVLNGIPELATGEIKAPKLNRFKRANPGLIMSSLAGCAILLTAVLMFSATSEKGRVSHSVADPSPATVLTARAKSQLKLHQSQETETAIQLLNDALTAEPDHHDARLTLSFALTTRVTKFRGNNEDKRRAEALSRELIEEDDTQSNSWSALGYALSSQDRTDEALAAYRRAYELNPDNAPALSSAAHLYLMRGDLPHALDLELQSRRRGGRSRYAEIQIAQTLDMLGLPQAGDWYAEAARLNPHQVVVTAELARSYLRHGHYERAYDVLDTVNGDDKNSPQILHLKARAAHGLGRIEDAHTYMVQAGDHAKHELAAFTALHGNSSKAEEYLKPDGLFILEAGTSAYSRIDFAEIAASLGRNKQAAHFLAQAVGLGWRDKGWLHHSPYLKEVMQTSEGLDIAKRLDSILISQRDLILSDDSFTPSLEQSDVSSRTVKSPIAQE